jgi:hypothetical protein
VQKVVDYINGLSSWKAAVGPDVNGATELGVPRQCVIVAANATPGSSKQNPTYIYRDSGTNLQLSAGIEATEGKYNRIKTITASYGTTSGTNGVITVLIYDGDNIVWRRDVNTTAYNTAANANSSPSTISFISYTDKGISSSYGKSLVAVVSSDTAVANTSATTNDKVSDHNISIVYDQF